VSLPLEKLIHELNALSPDERNTVIKNVPWLKEQLIALIQNDLINLEAKNIFDEITRLRESTFAQYGQLPDCVDFIRADRAR
jgi:hypothetical protein